MPCSCCCDACGRGRTACIGWLGVAGGGEKKIVWLFVHDHEYHDVIIHQDMELVPIVEGEETSDTMTSLLLPNGMVLSYVLLLFMVVIHVWKDACLCVAYNSGMQT